MYSCGRGVSSHRRVRWRSKHVDCGFGYPYNGSARGRATVLRSASRALRLVPLISLLSEIADKIEWHRLPPEPSETLDTGSIPPASPEVGSMEGTP